MIEVEKLDLENQEFEPRHYNQEIIVQPSWTDRKTNVRQAFLFFNSEKRQCYKYVLTNKTSEIIYTQITNSGSWGSFVLTNGLNRVIFDMRSTFTGSFKHNIAMKNGIIIYIAASLSPTIAVCWRELK